MGRHEIRVELAGTPGNLAAVAADLAACRATILDLDVHSGGEATLDRLVVQVSDERRPDLAAAAARCGATLLALDEADPASPAPPRRVPTTLERLVVLDDGGLVRLRHLGPGDRDAVEAFRARCSFPVPEVDDGLAALVGSDIVGIGRGDGARPAVGVEDRHQRRGIGSLLTAEISRLS